MKVRLAFDAYRIVEQAVEDGVRYGWQRLFKYRDKPAGLPDDATVIDELTAYVTGALSEVVDWECTGERNKRAQTL